MTRTVNAVNLLVRTSVRVAPWQSAACLCESLGASLNVLQQLYLAWFVDGALRRDLGRMSLAAAAFVIQIGIGRALIVVGMNARANQLERVGYVFDTRIAEITASIPTIDHLGNPEYLDQIQILREEEGALGLAVNTLLNSLNGLVAVVGTVALAFTADWRMLLVAVMGLPMIVSSPLVARWQAQAEKSAAEPGRCVSQLLELGSNVSAAGEIRVFGLGEHLRERLQSAATAWQAPKNVLAMREACVAVVSHLLFYGGTAGILVWLIHDLIEGSLGTAAFTLALLLVGRLQNTSSQLRGVMSNVASMTRTALRFIWLQDLKIELGRSYSGTQDPPARLETGIQLRNVSYTYPGAVVPAIHDLNFDLPAGAVVALVGENGAGKSTLVDVVTSLIHPSEGSVVIDGQDTRELDLSAWREAISGAFQDHVRYEFTVADNVGIGDLPHRADRLRIDTALHEGAAENVVSAVPGGLSAQLGSSWVGGVDLSGGQWQRLAIARGVMRQAPLLRVLDEPTSALDAATENELFHRFARAASAGRRSGTVTLLVTHRFSTVSAADRVVVLDAGRIVEQGSHAELLRRKGRYAELYELQAHGYR